MKIARFRHSAEAAVAVLLISGAGIAFAGNSSPATPVAVAPAAAPAVAAPAAATTVVSTSTSAAAAEATTETSSDTTTETGTEATGAEEPGDANLPGGGHADDPSDPNADHQFDGVE
jgi:hypothetical protein